MKYIGLFMCFLKIGLFSFGGGYASVAMIREQVVEEMGWLGREEFSNLVTISQLTPGPIAVNSATFVGTKVGGLLGAAAATLGCILPSCLMLILFMALCNRFLRPRHMQKALNALHPGVIALIAKAGIDLFWQTVSVSGEFHWEAGLLAACSMFLLLKKRWGPVGVILLSGAAGVTWNGGRCLLFRF